MHLVWLSHKGDRYSHCTTGQELTGQVPESSECYEPRVWAPAHGVARRRSKVEDGLALRVEEHGLGGHEAVDDDKLGAGGGPLHVVDGSLLV